MSPIHLARIESRSHMCTYNGERFLAEQLDSIAKQSRLPDELVVCDDGSTDRTVAWCGNLPLGSLSRQNLRE